MRFAPLCRQKIGEEKRTAGRQHVGATCLPPYLNLGIGVVGMKHVRPAGRAWLTLRRLDARR